MTESGQRRESSLAIHFGEGGDADGPDDELPHCHGVGACECFPYLAPLVLIVLALSPLPTSQSLSCHLHAVLDRVAISGSVKE